MMTPWLNSGGTYIAVVSLRLIVFFLLSLSRSAHVKMDKIGIIQLIISAFVLYVAIEAVRRLYFSKISHIPGPRLAALTYYYQTYWDLWPNDGQFTFHTKDLHRRYGPIIRYVDLMCRYAQSAHGFNCVVSGRFLIF